MQNFSSEDTLFWKTKGINWMRWSGVPEYYEGMAAIEAIVDYVGTDTVRDIGSGYGRLCKFFDPKKYIGYDINPAAASRAKILFPSYKIYHWDLTALPYATSTILVNSLIVINNEEIVDFLKLVSQNTDNIIISEVMDNTHHPEGLPFNFYSRTLDAYCQILDSLNFKLSSSVNNQHTLYDKFVTVAKFSR